MQASLESSPTLTYENEIIITTEGSQQGDPLSCLEYCDAAQPTLLATSSRTKLGFGDDTNLEGRISQVANDAQLIIDSHQHTGLHLNAHKCEIIANTFELIDQYSIFKDFKRTAKEDMTLSGAPGLEGKAVDKALQEKIADMEQSVKSLSLLKARDALCLLNNALAMLKLQYIRRTSLCARNPLLSAFDGVLRNELSKILKVELNDSQWKQASLPVQMGRLGVRSACMLAPSAFLASAAATLSIQKQFCQNKAATNKIAKYNSLATTHHVIPIAIETAGPWNSEASEFIAELGKKITEVTLEPLETHYLFQRLSIALQRGNEIAFRNTCNAE